MKILKIVSPLLVLVVLLLAWVAPIGPLPGFFIGGNDATVPDSWGDTTQTLEIRLGIQGTIPRVVVIWMVQVNGDLYVVGSKNSGWVKMLNTGGNVEMRMDDNTYSLAASLVTTGLEAVLEAYLNKYRADYPDIVNGFPDLEEAKGTVSVFRLARTGA